MVTACVVVLVCCSVCVCVCVYKCAVSCVAAVHVVCNIVACYEPNQLQVCYEPTTPKKNRLNLQGFLLINKSTAVSFFPIFQLKSRTPFFKGSKTFCTNTCTPFQCIAIQRVVLYTFFKGAMYIEDLSFFKEILHTEHLSCPVLPLWSGDPFSRLPRSCQQQRSNCYSLSL